MVEYIPNLWTFQEELDLQLERLQIFECAPLFVLRSGRDVYGNTSTSSRSPVGSSCSFLSHRA